MNNELEALKRRIIRAAHLGVRIDHIRDNYSPIGGSMAADLVNSGEFVLGWTSSGGDTTTNITTVENWRDRDWEEVILLAAYK